MWTKAGSAEGIRFMSLFETPFRDISHIRGDEPVWQRELKQSEERSWTTLRNLGAQKRHHLSERTTYVLSDVMKWLADLPPNSIHAVVTDPPYGIIEYEDKNHAKLRKGRGGVWRIPPSFDGAKRHPVPRFTVERTGSGWACFCGIEPAGFNNDISRIYRVRV